MRSVFLVTGQSGSYEDVRFWNVAAFETRDAAETWRRSCQSLYEEALLPPEPPFQRRPLTQGWKHPLDDDMQHSDSDPVEYRVEELAFHPENK